MADRMIGHNALIVCVKRFVTVHSHSLAGSGTIRTVPLIL